MRKLLLSAATFTLIASQLFMTNSAHAHNYRGQQACAVEHRHHCTWNNPNHHNVLRYLKYLDQFRKKNRICANTSGPKCNNATRLADQYLAEYEAGRGSGPTVTPPPKKTIKITFYQIYVKDNSEGSNGGHKGEFRLTLSANNKSKDFELNGVRDRKYYRINQIIRIESNRRNKPFSVKVHGYEKDSGNTGGNDYIGQFSRSHAVKAGYYSAWSSTNHYRLFYKVDIEK